MSEIQEKLNAEAARAIVYAKDLTVAAQLPVVYPEAFALGILLFGPNSVTRIFAQINAELQPIIQRIQESLNNRQTIPVQVLHTTLMLSEESKEMLKLSEQSRVKLGAAAVGVHHIMIALLKFSEPVRNAMEPEGVTVQSFEALVRNLINIKSSESHGKPLDLGRSAPVLEEPTPSGGLKGLRQQAGVKKARNVLEAFCMDLTTRARDGELDPVIGREREIGRVITTLCRKKKSSPLLVGEHGTGKTAIVEGVAQKIAANRVPDMLRGKRIFAVDMAAMVAGTNYRGQFEDRMKAVLQAAKDNPDTILFIDEAHTIVGAGGAMGALDASNIMKPALARGEVKCIAATTENEYKKFFKKDGALDRRFQKISVDEPNAAETMRMLQGVKGSFETHHNCIIDDVALEAAVSFSGRYVAERHFPDKAIDVIDEACARYANGFGGEKISISREHIAEVVAEQAGVPISVILPSDIQRLELVEKTLTQHVIGQQQALNALMRALRRSYSGVHDPERPMGSFIFAGPSGTGKSYTAEEICKSLFVTPDSFIRINMTEFGEKFQQSRLVGSPPGYVGHGDRNQFTDKVLRHPYCFILLDEIDKSDPDVIKLLLPVLSSGRLTDSEGLEVNFRNALIGMTTNLGFGDDTQQGSIGFGKAGSATEYDLLKEKVVLRCKERFGPEFINRIDEFVVFNSFTDTDLEQVSALELEKLKERLATKSVDLVYGDTFLTEFVRLSKACHGQNGFRIKRAVTTMVEPVLIDVVLSRLNKTDKIEVGLKVENDKIVVV